MPKAVKSLDFGGYDYVISSSSGFAHGAITDQDTKLIVYYHSPARYLWDWTHEYRKDIWWNTWLKWFLLGRLFWKLRKWDIGVSKNVDTVLANSHNTKKRIEKYYRRNATVIYPPVETTRFSKDLWKKAWEKKDRYYIILSALTEFKKIEVAIKWFNTLKNTKLLIIWDGTYKGGLEKLSKGKNIEFVWAKYGDELVKLVQNSEGLVFPGEEDFWIVPIEVMAAGKPVFAYRWWWLLETVIEWKTWEFFDKKNGVDFVEKFQKFDANNLTKKYKAQDCKKQAEKFSEEAFSKKIKSLLIS